MVEEMPTLGRRVKIGSRHERGYKKPKWYAKLYVTESGKEVLKKEVSKRPARKHAERDMRKTGLVPTSVTLSKGETKF